MNRWFDDFPIIGKYVSGKIVLSFFMVLFSLILFLIFRVTDRLLCVFAMIFSFIGDVALNHKPTISSQSKRDFILGGTAFIVAHIFYCVAYGLKIKENNFEIFNIGVLFAIAILLAVTIYMLAKADLRMHSKLFLFGVVYLWLTGINYITIFSFAISVKSIESICLIGGLSFLASDVIIGLEKFTGLRSKVARELVWWFYPIGQILLISVG